MGTKTIPLSALGDAIAAELRKVKGGTQRAVKRAREGGAAIIAANAPVAHGELRDSVHATETGIAVDAPHALGVEIGQPPTEVPLETILSWCEVKGIDPAAARAIQRKIAEEGTPPTHFVGKSMPEIEKLLEAYLAFELRTGD